MRNFSNGKVAVERDFMFLIGIRESILWSDIKERGKEKKVIWTNKNSLLMYMPVYLVQENITRMLRCFLNVPHWFMAKICTFNIARLKAFKRLNNDWRGRKNCSFGINSTGIITVIPRIFSGINIFIFHKECEQ